MAMAASAVLGTVLDKLSHEWVASYVASSELGLDSHKIKLDLLFTQGLLQEAERMGTGYNNPGLTSLLVKLSQKASEADGVLSELHYFMIQDQLDGTHLVKPDLGGGLKVEKVHAHRTLGNCLPYFSCTCTISPQNGTKSDGGDHVDDLSFDSVSMSIKIKSVLEETLSLCDCVSKLLEITPRATTTDTIMPPLAGSTVFDTLHGRTANFEKTIDVITRCGETLSVLPVVGQGGIGKTTFVQHLYNDRRVEEHFTVRVWLCVSNDFDVLKLTRQILTSIPATEEEESINSETANLEQLQRSIAQRLESRRFLIVLDDVWEINGGEAWKALLAPFSRGQAKGNMVLVTTRFPFIAEMVKTVDPVELQGLDPEDFLTFLEACIFGTQFNRNGRDIQNLIDIARETANKLKGSPLAARTTARLLSKDFSHEHWMGVLHNNEWLNEKNTDDIMPSLKLSYDYLPFYLQRCFSHLSLFPEGHRFNHLEMGRFWVAIGLVECNENCEDELVGYGFLVKGGDKFNQYYAMPGLMHELSLSVSAPECLNISGLHFKADMVPQSIRYLSITLEDRYDETFEAEMIKLKTKIGIANLRALMIFCEYEERFAEILKDVFKEVNNLHVLFIVVRSLDDLPQNLSTSITSKLDHLTA